MTAFRTPVNWLRAFEVAARHLSLSAAAQELSVTTAAVSQQVRLLEQRLGAPLFVRHSRGLRLTRVGEALVPACRDSFGRLDAALVELFGQRGKNQLVVRVALGFARQWLFDKLASFCVQQPDIRVRVVASVWSGQPLDSSIDVDIRIASGPVSGAESHQLTRDELFPVCSPRLAARGSRLRYPSDLRSQPLLATIGFAQGWREWFQAAKVKEVFPAARLEFDSMRLALETAALGHGIALARTSYAEDLLRTRQLKRLFDVRLAAADNLYLALARGTSANTPAALFRDWLVRAAT
jgi:LysR family transcriptional regulator, glycine cleavage system transcriptional activator